ncbi:MAG: hypothetical protein WA139_01480 [Candidatus Aenigmatarchaeota archaeon]
MIEKEKLQELTDKSIGERTIGKMLGKSRSEVRWWRIKYGIKAKPKLNIPEGTKKNTFYRMRYCRNLRQKILHRLGNKCIRCGFSDWRALQIDHIHGRGNKEFDSFRRNGIIKTNQYYRKLLKMPLQELTKNYQLLCANCNWIKKYENKEHKKWFIGSAENVKV